MCAAQLASTAELPCFFMRQTNRCKRPTLEDHNLPTRLQVGAYRMLHHSLRGVPEGTYLMGGMQGISHQEVVRTVQMPRGST